MRLETYGLPQSRRYPAVMVAGLFCAVFVADAAQAPAGRAGNGTNQKAPVPIAATVTSGSTLTTTTALWLTLDPSAPAMVKPTNAGEFNTEGQLEGWKVTGSSDASVKGGMLKFTPGSGEVRVERKEMAGPELELGFNDYIEFKLQIPSGHKGEIKIQWGTDVEKDFSPKRTITIPTDHVKSGSHVYRLDMGPYPKWIGILRDLAILFPAGGERGTAPCELDYVRVGDLAGPQFVPETFPDIPSGGPYEMKSKHFRFVWNEKRQKEGVDAKVARGSLRNAEKCLQCMVKVQGYKMPKPMFTLTCVLNGCFGGGTMSQIDPWGWRVDPPTWVLPHEMFHALGGHQGGGIPGAWGEAIANYVREQWIYWLTDDYWTETSNLEGGYISNTFLWHGHGRFYYICWPFFLYLDENPDNLPGLGPRTVASMWQRPVKGPTIYHELTNMLPPGMTQDLIGLWARRQVTWDYSHGAALRKNVGWTSLQQIGMSGNMPVIAELRQRPDDPEWWQVPPEMAPQQATYQMHELIPTPGNRTVTVDFRGLPIPGRIADWRCCFVAVSSINKPRYGDLWNTGPQSITLAPDEQKLFLTVAATPEDWMNPAWDDELVPYQSHPAQARFLYEMKITGAVPRESSWPGRGGRKHPNGGGSVAGGARVDPTAFVGPDAMVMDGATVKGTARVEDFAVVGGNAQVLDNAVVSGHARVMDKAIVKDWAKVRDYALVCNDASVSGYARVLQHASVTGNGILKDFATMKGIANTWCDPNTPGVTGDAVLDGDYMNGRTVSNGFQFGFVPWNGSLQKWLDTRKAPARLFAAYNFDTDLSPFAKDRYGVTEGLLVGEPKWVQDESRRNGALDLNGKDQYVLLDRSVSDFTEITVSIWAKPRGTAVDVPLIHFGWDESHKLIFTAQDKDRFPKLTVKCGANTATLVAKQAVNTGTWTHLAFTIGEGKAAIYVAGKVQAEGTVNTRPDQLQAPNTNTGKQQNYVGRGIKLEPSFDGRVDCIRFYSKALAADAIGATANEDPPPAPLKDATLAPGKRVEKRRDVAAGGQPGKAPEGVTTAAAKSDTTPAAFKAPAAKPVEPKRELQPEVLKAWEAKTRERLVQVLKENGKPRFEVKAMGVKAAVLSQNEKGVRVLFDKGGQTEMPWNQLGRSEYRSLALNFADTFDTPADHALAAFYLLCDGEEEKASTRLQKAGKVATDEVRAAFFAKPPSESAETSESD